MIVNIATDMEGASGIWRASLTTGHLWERKPDCLMLVGRHAMAGTQRAFREHTMSSRSWFELRINGQAHGEIGN